MGLTPHQLYQGIKGQEKEQSELTCPGEAQTVSQKKKQKRGEHAAAHPDQSGQHDLSQDPVDALTGREEGQQQAAQSGECRGTGSSGSVGLVQPPMAVRTNHGPVFLLEGIPISFEQCSHQKIAPDQPERFVEVKRISDSGGQTDHQEDEKEVQKDGIPSPGLHRIFIRKRGLLCSQVDGF